ncbi:MAG: YbhB/YbcL family Raf kinase inhibitor-like protein [Phycisphaerae bacterium]
MKHPTYMILAMLAAMATAMFGALICLTPALAAKAAAPARPVMTLTSPAFHNHSVLPTRFTADGQDVSPPLAWCHVPRKTVSLVIVMIDPDAPGPLAFRHWMIINIPPTAKGLPEHLPAAKRIAGLPSARQGTNSFGKLGYGGPSPPPGPAHHYRIILYALSRKLLFAPDCLPCLHHAMADYVLARSTLHVHYGR